MLTTIEEVRAWAQAEKEREEAEQDAHRPGSPAAYISIGQIAQIDKLLHKLGLVQ